MANEDLYFDLPTENTTNPADILFSLPNQMTGDLFINMWLIALYGVLTISATRYQQPLDQASLFGSFGTFMVTFLLVLLSSFTDTAIAGGNQLIPAAVLLAANLLWNFMTGGRY